MNLSGHTGNRGHSALISHSNTLFPVSQNRIVTTGNTGNTGNTSARGNGVWGGLRRPDRWPVGAGSAAQGEDGRGLRVGMQEGMVGW